ncbi:hypothetical protein [Chryseobacterium turcicum]|uniref:Uncharacterized protein n=1 Tax=Chryseobacterium turcicum TaxID=2898076 RepID=A0A9Q3V4H0_9FLAO|nr:hypothetical protein [Chryseobacterium turcicum]MCD1117548.1 hypothetical protein [Chryseobacterium turcicum]
MSKELSFYEFTQLPEEEQYELVFSSGEFIDSSVKGEVKYVLYKLYSFFVEVAYNSYDNKIINMSTFMNSQK